MIFSQPIALENMFKKETFKLYMFLLVLFTGLSASGLFVNAGICYAEVVDRIVAVVNDEIIILSELNEKYIPYVEKLKTFGYPPEKELQILYKVRDDILERLIEKKLENQEIKKSQISVEETEIDKAIEQIKERSFFTDEDMRQALAKDGLTIEKYREQMKEQILKSKLINYKVKSRVVITNEDIKKYYDHHPEKYSGKEKYHLRNIIMKFPVFGGDSEKQAVYQKMTGVLEQIREGKTFEDMARKYSESSLASSGGDLGEFSLDDLSVKIRDAVKELTPGEFTPVLETEQGYQIFFLEEILEASGKTLEEVTTEIENILYDEELEKKFQTWISDLKKQSHIKLVK